MTAMSTTEAFVGLVIIVGLLATLAGFVVFFSAVAQDIARIWRARFHPDAGRSESPPIEGPPAPIFPLEMQRRRRRNRSAA